MAWYDCIVDNSYDGVTGFRKGYAYDLEGTPPSSYFTAIAAPNNVRRDDDEHHAQTDLNDNMHIYDNIIHEGDVTFNEDVFFDNITGDAGIQKFVAWQGGTGLIDITLPGLAKTADTEFTVYAGSGNFLDMTDPNNPTVAHIHWSTTTGNVDAYAATNLRTVVAVDAAGDIQQFADTITAAQRRTHIVLGLLTHTDGATITQVNLLPTTAGDQLGKLTDLCLAVGFVNLSGNIYSGASSTVNSLAVTAGTSFACDRNFTSDKDSPNVNILEAEDPIASFFLAYSDGAGGVTITTATTLDTTKYDDLSGTPATLPTGFWVTHRIFRSTTTGSTLVIYGQAIHKGKVEAVTQINQELFNIPPGSEELLLRSYLSVKEGTAGLQDSATSIFTPANKYGTNTSTRLTNGFDLGVPSFLSESFTSRGVSAGTFWLFGNYFCPAEDVTLTQASLTLAYGTANTAYGMRPIAVFAGDGTVDTGVVGLRVTGTTVTDAGVRTAADTQILTADITAPVLDEYLETTKKFIGQVTYELYVVSGSPTAYSVSFNYGLVKYEDYGNRDFMITDVVFTGLSGAADTAAEIVLLKHSASGWTYSAAGFSPGDGTITSMNTIYSTEDDLANNEPFNFKLDSDALNVSINGSDSEGIIVKLVAGQNNTFQILNAHIGVQI